MTVRSTSSAHGRAVGPPPATWAAPSGVREEAVLLATGVISFIHLPPGQPVGGLLICPPMGIAFRRNYRREVLLARSLSSRGVAVVRFHYRGTGSSLGTAEDITFERMRDDAVLAADWLVDQAGVVALAFLGTRLGGLVAASVSAGLRGAPLALWEPVTEGARYFQEASRARAIQHLRLGDRGTRSSPAGEIERSGSTDILGHRVHEPLYRSLLGRTLVDEAGTEGRPLLLIRPSPRSGRRGDPYGSLVERWRNLDFPVEVRHVDHEEGWWFSDPRELTDEAKESSETLVDTTAGWIERHLSAGLRAHD